MVKQMFFCAFLLFVFSDSVFSQITYKKNEVHWIPEDFNPNTDLLLIQETDLNEREKKAVLHFLEKEYPHSYEIVGKLYNSDSAYSNRQKFRFSIVVSKLKRTMRSLYDAREIVTYIFDINFYDRLEKKTYPKPGFKSEHVSIALTKFLKIMLQKKKKANKE